MKNYIQEPQVLNKLETITCDICKIDYDNTFDTQEFLSWTNYCGYGSIFGDMNKLEIDICQHCQKKLFGNNARITEYGEY